MITLCRPPWSFPHPGAKGQWRALVDTVGRYAPVRIVQPEPTSVDSVYCRDVGLLLGSSFVRANFRKGSRVREVDHFLKRIDYPNVVIPPWWVRFEGGDVRRVPGSRSTILCGYGQRTSWTFLPWLRSIMDNEDDQLEVVGLRLVHPMTFHLDLCLCVFPNRRALIVKEAFSAWSLRYLVKHFPDHLFVSMSDRFACNGLLIGSVYIVSHAPHPIREWLQVRGIVTVLVDCSEFHKEDGGVHCLTND